MSVLEFRGARLDVRLGCSAEERAVPQAVDLDLAVRFAELPSACETDKLEGTVCYADLIHAARDACAGREFRLVERLAHELYALRKEPRVIVGTPGRMDISPVAVPFEALLPADAAPMWPPFASALLR